MIFISRYKNFKLGLRPTVKQLVHTGSGGEDVIIHKGVTVVFQNAVFDTANWREYERPESPDHINVIRSEQALIDLMKKSPFFGIDFFERVVETPAQRKAKLLAEIAKLEAEESAEDPDNAPSFNGVAGQDADVPKVAKKTASKVVAKKAPAKKKGKTASTVEL